MYSVSQRNVDKVYSFLLAMCVLLAWGFVIYGCREATLERLTAVGGV